MNNLMRAVTSSPPGLIENLFVNNSRPIPTLRPSECLIKVYYSALNRADISQRKGIYPPPPGDSDILGLEAVGVVDQLGTSSTSKWKKNDRVMALCAGGGNAEYVAVHESNLIRIPDWMSFREAAAVPEVWLTAFQLLYWISSLTKPDSCKEVSELNVLVHAGASGVGTSLIQMLKNVLKVKNVFATVGSEDKRAFLERELKVSKAFNYKLPEEQNFDELILKMTNNAGVDLLFDCVGGSYWERNSNVLAVDSEWILYGLMGGASLNGDLFARMQRKRIHLKATTLRSRSIEYKHRLMVDFESRLLEHFETGTVKAIIEREFDLEKIANAHAFMESNANIGKILLKVADAGEKKDEL